jgi:hypothetical protein
MPATIVGIIMIVIAVVAGLVLVLTSDRSRYSRHRR